MPKKKNILICPLDWGLGHATRLVPIIEMLISKGANVIIGADNRPLSFLEQRFPELTFVKFPGFSPQYPKNGSMTLSMIRSFPSMMEEAKKSELLLQELIHDLKIDVIISDNRYELSSKHAYSVFITHQLNIQTPGFLSVAKPFITKKINGYIKKYNELWIPDVEEDPSLSGILSHSSNKPLANHYFIGPLSRFKENLDNQKLNDPEILILISGPEPQRTLLEEVLFEQIIKTNFKTLILQGKPENNKTTKKRNVKIIPHLPDNELNYLINQAKIVICRPGYSTVMDLAVLGKKAIFIPTPGQTEQEYLANKFLKEGLYYFENQSHFNLKRAMGKYSNYTGLKMTTDQQVLESRINKLMD